MLCNGFFHGHSIPTRVPTSITHEILCRRAMFVAWAKAKLWDVDSEGEQITLCVPGTEKRIGSATGRGSLQGVCFGAFSSFQKKGGFFEVEGVDMNTQELPLVVVRPPRRIACSRWVRREELL